MLINLSSQGEIDPAKFSNYFSEMIDIKPFSYVCLVKGQIIRTKNQKQVAIIPDTTMNFRYTCYDVVQIVLNPGSLTNMVLDIQSLTSYINGLLIGASAFPYDKGVIAIPVDDLDGDIRMDLKWYNDVPDPATNSTWKQFTFQNVNYYTTKFGQINNLGGAVAFPESTVPGDSIAYVWPKTTAPYGFGMSPIWDRDVFTPNANQLNKNAFNLLTNPTLVPNAVNGYEPLQYWISQPNAKFEISFGRTESDNTFPPVITLGPINGTPNNSPASGPKNNLLNVTHETRHVADGAMPGRNSINIFNSEIGNYDPDTLFSDNQMGDYWEYSLHPTDAELESFQQMYYFRVTQWRNTSGLMFAYNGNVGAITDRPGNNNYFLTDNITPPVNKTAMSNMSYIYDNEYMKEKYTKMNNLNLNEFARQWERDFQQTTAEWNGLACIGVRTNFGFQQGVAPYFAPGSGWVYSRLFGQPGSKQFLVSYEDGQSSEAQYRYAAGCWGFSDYSGVQRADNSKIEIPNAYRVTASEIKCDVPTLVSFSVAFGYAARTQMPSNLNPEIRTLLGGNGTGSRVLEIQMNQGGTALPGGWDWRLTDNNGVQYVGFLIDGGANRISFRSTNNVGGFTYSFMVRWYGTGVGTFQITVVEYSSATGLTTTFDIPATVPITAGSYLAGFNTFAGINPLSDNTQEDYNDYSPMSYWCNMRIYQKSLKSAPAPNTEAEWDIECAGLTEYFDLIPTYVGTNFWYDSYRYLETPPSIVFYPNAVENNIIPSAAMERPEYTIVGCPQANTNTGVIIEREETGIVPQDINVPIINNLWIPPCQFSPDTVRATNLDQLAYREMGEGLVNMESAENVLDFRVPETDQYNNILQVPTLVNGFGQENPTSTIQTEADISVIESEALNIEITNLTHRTMNGTNRSMDKTIYQLPLITHTEEVGSQEIVEMTPPSKVWIPLNNPGSLPLNRLDVQISKLDGKKATLNNSTTVVIQVENDKDLLN